MVDQSGERPGVAMTEEERATAVATLAAHIGELEQAKREGDDDRWDDIANDGVVVVVGGATWELWLGDDGWTASRPTYGSEIGSPVFGQGDLIGTVGPAGLSAEEIVRRLNTLEFDDLTEG
jgi:hypothetical protein